MNSETNVDCPKCGAVLPTTGLVPGVLVQCSRCGNQFSLGGGFASQPTTSGKAVSSLVLSLIPVPIVTGLAAIIFGIWALVDIKRHAGQLRGSGMAVCGILFGFLCGFICTPIVGVAYWIATQFRSTNAPAEVAAITATIVEIDVPQGLEPIVGIDSGIIGWKMAIYGDRPNNPTTMLLVMRFPTMMAGSQQQMEQQLQQQMQAQQQQGVNIEDSRIVTYTIRGSPVQVTEGFGKDSGTGNRARQYMAMIPGEHGPVMVLLITQDPPEGDTEPPEMEDGSVRLTEEQVQKVFESIK